MSSTLEQAFEQEQQSNQNYNETVEKKPKSGITAFDVILRVLFGITYILTIVFFILHMQLPCLACFVIQSFATAFIILRYVPSKYSNDDIQDLISEAQLFESHKEEVTRLREQLSEKTVAVEKLEEQVAHLEEDLAKQTETITTLNTEIEQNKDPYLQDKYVTLLPHVTEYDEAHPSIDIINLVSDVIKEFEQDANQAGIQIQLSSASSFLYVKAAPSRIKVLFRNIIDNSIKYMQQSGVLVITISNIGSDIFVVLKDNGQGLSKQETDHVFELNYQGSNRISGNGLGLAQSKAIVEYYGGTIYAKSSKNLGMAIYIQLPTN